MRTSNIKITRKRRKRKENLECKYQVRVMMHTVQRKTMMRVHQVYQAYKNVIDLIVRARMMRKIITITITIIR